MATGCYEFLTIIFFLINLLIYIDPRTLDPDTLEHHLPLAGHLSNSNSLLCSRLLVKHI